jgi:hypothetical protein
MSFRFSGNFKDLFYVHRFQVVGIHSSVILKLLQQATTYGWLQLPEQ